MLCFIISFHSLFSCLCWWQISQTLCSTHVPYICCSGKFTLGILGRKQIQTQFTLHVLNYKLLKPRAMIATMLVICFWLIMQHDIYPQSSMYQNELIMFLPRSEIIFFLMTHTTKILTTHLFLYSFLLSHIPPSHT